MIRSMMGRKKVDRNTLLLLHFDGSLKDEASGKPYVGSNMSYVVGKFKNCVSFSGNGYVKISGTNAINESLCPNYTVDFWIKLKSGVRNGIMSKGDGGGSYSFDIMEESDGRIFFGLRMVEPEGMQYAILRCHGISGFILRSSGHNLDIGKCM